MLSGRVHSRDIAVHSEYQDHKHQKPGCNGLAEEVACLVAFDCRHGAECAELGVLVCCEVEMILIEHPYKACSCESSEHLCDYITGNGTPFHGARNGASETYYRVEVCSGNRTCDEDSRHYGKTPSHGDHYPSCSLGLASFKTGRGAYAVSEKHQHQCADELENVLRKHFHNIGYLVVSVLLMASAHPSLRAAAASSDTEGVNALSTPHWLLM